MKKLIPICLLFVMLTSCTVTSLYTWNNYNVTSYNYLKNHDQKSLEDLIKTYEKIIAKQQGSRKVVPPGIYADYGFALIQSGKTDEGIKMLKMEATLYPESATFMANIIKTYSK